jgi:NADH:ubiquinone reductase (H+-translocating)
MNGPAPGINLISETGEIQKPFKKIVMKNGSRQIVLIGGGYASIWAYRSIVQELAIEMMQGQVRIKVICPDDFHFFHGWTAESLMGIIRDQNRMSPLQEVFKHAEIIKGRAVRINPHTRHLYIDMPDGTQKALLYDQLLLGTGSADASSIEGLTEYAYQLKSHKDYCCTKMRIQFLLKKASESDESTARQILRFVIAGSGFTGVELAANLAELIKSFIKQYPGLRNIKPAIHLINSRHNLLPGLDAGLHRIRRYAERTLVNYGIQTFHQTRIIRVTARGAFLSDGSFIECPMVISTIGQSRILLEGTKTMERDPEKRILTNSFLQVANHRGIWGAGDAVHVTHSKSKKACPANALWAIKQGKHAGKNIARAILSQSLKPFTYKGLGQCASLGIGKGLGDLYGIQFTGWTAWIMRWFFFQHFMPSKKVMWREIGDWFHLLVSGKRRDFKLPEYRIHNGFSGEQVYAGDLNQLVYQN